jgi:hypothetical protein
MPTSSDQHDKGAAALDFPPLTSARVRVKFACLPVIGNLTGLAEFDKDL